MAPGPPPHDNIAPVHSAEQSPLDPRPPLQVAIATPPALTFAHQFPAQLLTPSSARSVQQQGQVPPRTRTDAVPLTLRCNNVGSLTEHKLHEILCLGGDLWLLQETRLSVAAQTARSNYLHAKGCTALWSQPSSDKHCPAGGVGIIARLPLVALTVKSPALRQSGRALLAWLPVAGPRGVLLATFYGISGASSDSGLADQNSLLLRHLLDEIASYGPVPCVLGGDFNQDLVTGTGGVCPGCGPAALPCKLEWGRGDPYLHADSRRPHVTSIRN